MPPRELHGSQMTIRAINSDGTYGEPIEFIEPFLIEEEPVETETSNEMTLRYLNNITTTFSGTLILPHKKMSRKKFKKLLMSFPIYERNEADRWCRFIGCAKGRVGYFRTYFDTLLVPYSFDLMHAIVRQLKETEE